MHDIEGIGEKPLTRARAAAREARPWLEKIARFGHVTKGALYLIVGVLAITAAFGAGGRTTDPKGAFRDIFSLPGGSVLLGATAAGLFGYALWRFLQALLNPDCQPADLRGGVTRAGYAISGVAHAALGVSAVQLLRGLRVESGETAPKVWTAALLTQPFGPWLVGIAGATCVAVGAMEAIRAWRARFRRHLELGRMNESEKSWATILGRLGYAAHGAVLAAAGAFLIRAAVELDPRKARGLGGVLRAFAESPFGPFALAAIAVGLVAYGITMFVEARYRRIACA